MLALGEEFIQFLGFGQIGEAFEAKKHQKFPGSTKEHRFTYAFGATDDPHHIQFHQRVQYAARVDAADVVDVDPGHRLFKSDDGQDLKACLREAYLVRRPVILAQPGAVFLA